MLRSTGSAPVRGRGVSLMLRSGTYWACVCQIAVTPSTGEIVVEKYTIAVDPGIVVNPMQLKRNVEGGAVMGISHALFEEVMFDESGITTEDWNSYPIPTMADIPEIKVVLLNNPKVGAYGGGSEAANALAAPAIAAALHDATGKGDAAASDETGLRAGGLEKLSEQPGTMKIEELTPRGVKRWSKLPRNRRRLPTTELSHLADAGTSPGLLSCGLRQAQLWSCRSGLSRFWHEAIGPIARYSLKYDSEWKTSVFPTARQSCRAEPARHSHPGPLDRRLCPSRWQFRSPHPRFARRSLFTSQQPMCACAPGALVVHRRTRGEDRHRRGRDLRIRRVAHDRVLRGSARGCPGHARQPCRALPLSEAGPRPA